MSQPNSTVSLLEIWRKCIHEQGKAFRMPLLRADILGRTLEFLTNSGPTTELLQLFFGSGRRHPQHVNFMCYWHGMEAILQVHGAFVSSGIPIAAEQRVTSLRFFRDRALLFAQDFTDDTYSELDLRRLYEEVQCQYASLPDVFNFWKDQIDRLPTDGTVTDDEVSRALLTWLLDLLKDYLHLEGSEPATPVSMRSTSSSSSEWCGPAQSRHAVEFERQDAALTSQTLSSAWKQQSPSLQRPSLRSPSPLPDLSVLEIEGCSCCMPSWLENQQEAEPLDVQQFRKNLKKQLMEHAGESNGESSLSLSHLFHAIRDTVATKSSHATIRAGVVLLSGIVLRRIRPMFRKLDKLRLQPAFHEDFDLVCALARSQAKGIDLLKRQIRSRAALHRVAWLLNLARSRCLRGVLDVWRHFGE